MRYGTPAVVTAALLMFLAAGDASRAATQAAPGKQAQAEELPPPEAGAVWAYIHEVSPYRGWQTWPSQAASPTPKPHGPLGRTYANEPAARAAKAGRPLPPGSIIVREGLSEKGQRLLNVAVMYKAAGYHPEGGDWYWLLASPQAAAQGLYSAQGKVGTCLACHLGEGGNDFVLGRRLGPRR